MKFFMSMILLASISLLTSCDGAVNTPKWAYELSVDQVKYLYNVLEVEEYDRETVTKNSSSFRVEIIHRSLSQGGSFRWYTDICTVPFDAWGYLAVNCY
jgi:hypothetical protein